MRINGAVNATFLTIYLANGDREWRGVAELFVTQVYREERAAKQRSRRSGLVEG
jgi:hypothetical protein